jgi:electron transfer flavoprotein alpha subunit
MLSYRKGVEVAERYLGARHAICITLKNSVVAATKAAAAASMKSMKLANAQSLRVMKHSVGGSSKSSLKGATLTLSLGLGPSSPTSGIRKLKEMAKASGTVESDALFSSTDDVVLSAPAHVAPSPTR